MSEKAKLQFTSAKRSFRKLKLDFSAVKLRFRKLKLRFIFASSNNLKIRQYSTLIKRKKGHNKFILKRYLKRK